MQLMLFNSSYIRYISKDISDWAVFNCIFKNVCVAVVKQHNRSTWHVIVQLRIYFLFKLRIFNIFVLHIYCNCLTLHWTKCLQNNNKSLLSTSPSLYGNALGFIARQLTFTHIWLLRSHFDDGVICGSLF